MALVHVTSEIGPLRAVLVHTPGRELVAVTPGNREDYLYDDIIDLELAQREHRRFVAGVEGVAPGDQGRTPLSGFVGGAPRAAGLLAPAAPGGPAGGPAEPAPGAPPPGAARAG